MIKIIFATMALNVLILSGCEKENSVVYTMENGKKTSEITKIKGKASYEVTGKKQIPIQAQKLHAQARSKGQAGDYDAAIKLLNKAIAIAPDWAYPYYDLAYTYLLMGNSSEALEMYHKVDSLEPNGFFTAKTAIWCLEREKNKIFPEATYLSYLYLEWLEPEKKMKAIDEMITKVPSFAPAWKAKAFLTVDNEERSVIIEKALNLNPDPETYGILILNKASLLNSTGKKSEAIQLITRLIENKNSTFGTSNMAKEMLKSLN